MSGAFEPGGDIAWRPTADYINNSKNGGGLLGYTGYYSPDEAVFGDYRNGIGVSPNCTVGPDCKGANRAAIALGVNYLLTPNTTLKAEYRYDFATEPVFFYVDSNTYKKNNSLFGASVVVGW